MGEAKEKGETSRMKAFYVSVCVGECVSVCRHKGQRQTEEGGVM